jgi:4-diphosphocytidyl-2-C-methyl-D-erythritol kinase
MRPSAVTVRAPGKVNLHLAVGNLAATGYHEVRTVLQAVSIFDELTATEPLEGRSRSSGVTISIAGEGAAGLPLDDTNLAVRAASLLAERTGIEEGVHLTLHKEIPVAAGMAGGSADAAAALVACDAFWNTGLTRGELEVLAAELGSDVPFALTGGTALGTGRGEQLSRVLARGSYAWVFALADGGLSTPAVYAELDRYRIELPRPQLLPDSDVLSALRQGDVTALGQALANDLEPPALRLRPALGRVLAAGRELGALGAVVSGSGPTCAFLAADATGATELAAGLSAEGICRTVRVANGPVHGARIIEQA